jgi:O-antigen ligase
MGMPMRKIPAVEDSFVNKAAYAALWIFVFSVPADPVFTSVTGVIVSKVAGTLALGLSLLAVLVTGRIRRLHLFHVAAVMFVLWVGIGLAFFYTKWLVIPNKFWTYVQLLLVLWMIWEFGVTRSRQLGLMGAYVLGALLSAIDTILLYRREADVLRRFAAGGIDGNDLAMTLVLAIPMAWYLAMTYRQPLRRWICSAYLLLGLFAIGLTGSRGGMLATMVALLIVPLTMARLSPGRRAIGIALMCISGAVAVTYIPVTLIERLATTKTEVEGGRLGGRWKIWQAGLEAFAQHPVVGYGPSAFKRAIDPWLLNRAQVAHNSFLSVLVEQGLVGFLFYCMMFFVVGRAVLRLPQLERRFALVLLAALATSMMPLTSEDSKRVWIVLAVLLGLSQTHLIRTGAAAWRLRAGQAAALARSQGRPREPLAAPVRNTQRYPTE